MNMKQYETEHYVFHYLSGTRAEKDIHQIAATQEACVSYICSVLDVQMPLKFQYFLCETAQEVGKRYNGEPCNGLAVYPDKIYAVYNDDIQCIGFHEDAHLISLLCFEPNPFSPAIEEGFAMYFDRKWWGIQNEDWVGYFLKSGKYVSVERLLDQAVFDCVDCTISYPIMGAFTHWLISFGGLERYLALFRKRDQQGAMEDIYGKTVEEINGAFVQYMGLFGMDTVLERRMQQLLETEGTL